MALDLLIQEAQGLSEDSLMEVVRFMRFIKNEHNLHLIASKKVTSTEEKPKIRQAGKYRGQFHISPDFDEPLEEFREYM
jgi:hypothetical protein